MLTNADHVRETLIVVSLNAWGWESHIQNHATMSGQCTQKVKDEKPVNVNRSRGQNLRLWEQNRASGDVRPKYHKSSSLPFNPKTRIFQFEILSAQAHTCTCSQKPPATYQHDVPLIIHSWQLKANRKLQRSAVGCGTFGAETKIQKTTTELVTTPDPGTPSTPAEAPNSCSTLLSPVSPLSSAPGVSSHNHPWHRRL